MLFVWGDEDRLIAPGRPRPRRRCPSPPGVVQGKHGWLINSPRAVRCRSCTTPSPCRLGLERRRSAVMPVFAPGAGQPTRRAAPSTSGGATVRIPGQRAPSRRESRRLTKGKIHRMDLGATWDGQGTDFAVYSDRRPWTCACSTTPVASPRVADRGAPRTLWHATCPASARASATASGSRAVRPGAGTATIRTSCCSIRTPRRSRAIVLDDALSAVPGRPRSGGRARLRPYVPARW